MGGASQIASTEIPGFKVSQQHIYRRSMSISSSVSSFHVVADRCTRVHTAIIHALKCSAFRFDHAESHMNF